MLRKYLEIKIKLEYAKCLKKCKSWNYSEIIIIHKAIA